MLNLLVFPAFVLELNTYLIAMFIFNCLHNNLLTGISLFQPFLSSEYVIMAPTFFFPFFGTVLKLTFFR